MNIQWLKSSFSEQPDGNCLELASYMGDLLMRESDDPDVVVTTASAPLLALLAGVQAGAFDQLP